MSFLCYKIIGKEVDSKEIIGWCAIEVDSASWYAVSKQVYKDKTFEKLKSKIETIEPNAEIFNDCGWIFKGEETKISNQKCLDMLTLDFAMAQLSKKQPKNDILK